MQIVNVRIIAAYSCRIYKTSFFKGEMTSFSGAILYSPKLCYYQIPRFCKENNQEKSSINLRSSNVHT